MEIKIQCDCGVRFAFDVEPADGAMPSTVTCPGCGIDATESANAEIRRQSAATQAPIVAIGAETVARPALRVMRPVEVPAPAFAPVPAAGVYVATEDSPPADEPVHCKYHPRAMARWMCMKCRQAYCDLCVSTRPHRGATMKICRPCGAECYALNVALIPEGVEKKNFFANLPAAFLYPFQGSGVVFLVAGTVFFAILEFLRAFAFFPFFAVWIINVIYVGYTFAFVQGIIQTAAEGSDAPASWPDISDFWSDICVPFFQMAGLFVACFGPGLGAAIWAGADYATYGEVNVARIAIAGVLLLIGAAYFPMAFLALAMSDTVFAINPLVVIPAIARIPLEYMAVLFVAGMIFSAKVVQLVLLEFVPIPVLPHLIAAGMGLYFLIVQARMLGLMYCAKREQLGWFSRR